MDELLPDNRISRDRLPPSGAIQAHPPAPSKLAVPKDDEAAGEARRRSGRETMLSFMLVALMAGMVFFFLNFVAFGVFSYVVAAVVAITAVGFLHYVLWGYNLSQDVAEEMQRERQTRQQEMDD